MPLFERDPKLKKAQRHNRWNYDKADVDPDSISKKRKTTKRPSKTVKSKDGTVTTYTPAYKLVKTKNKGMGKSSNAQLASNHPARQKTIIARQNALKKAYNIK